MKAHRLFTIAAAAMLLVAGATAAGAAVPADANGNADDRADAVGPSDGLSDRVPGFVSDTHDRIGSFLTGDLDNLGQSLSELLSGGEAADEAAEDGEKPA